MSEQKKKRAPFNGLFSKNFKDMPGMTPPPKPPGKQKSQIERDREAAAARGRAARAKARGQ